MSPKTPGQIINALPVGKFANLARVIPSGALEARKLASGIVINPAGYSFTSVALLDALKASELPIMEVHISNIHQREAIYHHSLVSKAATGVICGLGPLGYELALQALAARLLPA